MRKIRVLDIHIFTQKSRGQTRFCIQYYIVDRWGAKLQAGRSLIRVPQKLLTFSMYLTFTAAPLPRSLLNLWQKWVPEDISGGKARPVRKVDNLTAIYDPIV
jgi:hypothetical protein